MSAGGRSGRGREAGRAAREGAAGSPGALERARRAGRMRGGAEVRSDGGRFGRRGGRVVQALGVKNKPPLTKREEFGTGKRRREKTTLGTRAGGEPAPASWAAGARNRIGLQERGASGRRGPSPPHRSRHLEAGFQWVPNRAPWQSRARRGDERAAPRPEARGMQAGGRGGRRPGPRPQRARPGPGLRPLGLARTFAPGGGLAGQARAGGVGSRLSPRAG